MAGLFVSAKLPATDVHRLEILAEKYQLPTRSALLRLVVRHGIDALMEIPLEQTTLISTLAQERVYAVRAALYEAITRVVTEGAPDDRITPSGPPRPPRATPPTPAW
jgi:hypothetical protein